MIRCITILIIIFYIPKGVIETFKNDRDTYNHNCTRLFIVALVLLIYSPSVYMIIGSTFFVKCVTSTHHSKLALRGCGSRRSDALEPPSTRAEAPCTLHRHKVCRGLSQAFKVVRLYRTRALTTGETRCAGHEVGVVWFERFEPPRTSSNHIIAERARFFHRSSGWFNCTEPSLTTYLQGKQGVQGVVQGGSRRFDVLEPPRTSV